MGQIRINPYFLNLYFSNNKNTLIKKHLKSLATNLNSNNHSICTIKNRKRRKVMKHQNQTESR